jgi:hypothetical protein
VAEGLEFNYSRPIPESTLPGTRPTTQPRPGGRDDSVIVASITQQPSARSLVNRGVHPPIRPSSQEWEWLVAAAPLWAYEYMLIQFRGGYGMYSGLIPEEI